MSSRLDGVGAWPRLRRRLPVEEDRGTIALLLLVILVGLSLGALLVPMIVTQDRSTRFDSTRVQALHAAQAGIDAMLGRIRQVTTGDSSLLPCAPIAGPANLPATATANGVAAQYSVSVVYFTADPVQNPSSYLQCSSGSLIGTTTPSYAQLTSTGTVPPAINGSTNGRKLVSTYQFQTDNTTGGQVQISPASASSTPLCMDAGSTLPSNGYLVSMQACSTVTPPVAKQVFAYRNDLTIQLVSSVTSSTPNGLCLTQPTASALSLSTCPNLGGTPPYTQQWSYNQYGEYQTTVARSAIDGVLGTQCINLASQTAGLQLTLAACHYSAANPVQTVADTAQSWTNSPGVGAGAATMPQWMNYSESGRCIYIPPASAASDHLWSYPCTQSPWAIAGVLGAVPLGQRFTITGSTGPIASANGSCLSSPTLGGWVTATPCSVASQTTAGSQYWTVNTGAASVPYSTKFTVVNGNGQCLGLGPAAYTDTWSVIRTEPCTGAADQKWNVPTNALSLTLQNVER